MLTVFVEASVRRHPIENPDLPLDELMARWPATVPVFIAHRMLCVGCLIAPFHSVVDACAEHAVDENAFRAALLRVIED